MKKLLTLFTLALALVLAGCATNVADSRVTLEPAIRNKVQVGALSFRTDAQGFTEVKAPVTSMDARSVCAYDYRVEWTDAENFPIRSVTSSWTRFSMPPKGQYVITAMAPTTAAVNCTIYIQKAAN